MKVWLVYFYCGPCGDYAFGGIYSSEEKALVKMSEMEKEYCSGFHSYHIIDCIECEVDPKEE